MVLLSGGLVVWCYCCLVVLLLGVLVAWCSCCLVVLLFGGLLVLLFSGSLSGRQYRAKRE